MAANLVTFCCNTDLLERTQRLSSEPADLADILHASSLFGRPTPISALLLGALQLETSWQICKPHARGSATAMPGHQCGGSTVLSCRTAEGEEVGRFREKWCYGKV